MASAPLEELAKFLDHKRFRPPEWQTSNALRVFWENDGYAVVRDIDGDLRTDSGIPGIKTEFIGGPYLPVKIPRPFVAQKQPR